MLRPTVPPVGPAEKPMTWSAVLGGSSIRRQRIEKDVDGAVENAGIHGVHQITEIDGAVLGNGEDGTVVGEIALDVPTAALVGLIFGSGAKVDVDGADPDIGGAIILDPFGDGEVDFQDDFGPGAGTVGGRGVGEALGIEIVEFVLAEKIDFTGRGVRTRHGRIGEGGIAGTDLELRGGDSG